jgi:dethiobiotin synthetase
LTPTDGARRVVLLGTGTGVGKTYVAVALARALATLRPRAPVLALKPVESGEGDDPARPFADSAALDAANHLVRSATPHPRYGLRDPISPHLAARRQGITISLTAIAEWVNRHTLQCTAGTTIVETAGGVFSPIRVDRTNHDLARALDPALWVLVAPDSLGVLHDVTACLHAMRARGRVPDAVVLNAARPRDASTGTNAGELRTLGVADPVATIGRGDPAGARALADWVLRAAR